MAAVRHLQDVRLKQLAARVEQATESVREIRRLLALGPLERRARLRLVEPPR